MATASVQYTFAPLTDIKSSEANKNFADLVIFLNNQVIHADASRVFTAVPSGPALDPSSDNQFARKAYVDRGPTLTQSNFSPGALSETTSGSFANWPNAGGAYNLAHTKKLASTNILVVYMGSGFAVTAANTQGEFAVRPDAGADSVLTKMHYNTLNEHHYHTGGVTIGGLSAGVHTYNLRARRSSGTGGVRCDGNDRHQFIIIEVP